MLDRYVEGFMDGLVAAENFLQHIPDTRHSNKVLQEYIEGRLRIAGKTAAQLAIANAEARIIAMPPPPKNVSNHEHV